MLLRAWASLQPMKLPQSSAHHLLSANCHPSLNNHHFIQPSPTLLFQHTISEALICEPHQHPFLVIIRLSSLYYTYVYLCFVAWLVYSKFLDNKSLKGIYLSLLYFWAIVGWCYSISVSSYCYVMRPHWALQIRWIILGYDAWFKTPVQLLLSPIHHLWTQLRSYNVNIVALSRVSFPLVASSYAA